jgi:hypothetical protein
VDGFIFDSAPAYMHPYMLQRVIAASEPPSARRWLKSTYFSALSALQPVLDPGPPRPARFWANMERLGWGRPLLYLYSVDDPLCDAARVDALVAEKRRRGHDVRARRWTRSGHVSHLRHHTQEYKAILQHFLASLQRSDPLTAAAGTAERAGGSSRSSVLAPSAAPRARL